MAPGIARSPTVLPASERCKRLRLILAAEVRGKPAACRGLHGGGCSLGRRLRSQLLQARLVTLLRALLLLKLAVLRLQQPLLLALRPHAFRFLRLQFLHALLQAIDAALTLCALT